MKNIVIFLVTVFVFSLTFYSCSSKSCEVSCVYGNCIDNTCKCENGYTGEKCDEKILDSDESDNGSNGGGNNNGNPTPEPKGRISVRIKTVIEPGYFVRMYVNNSYVSMTSNWTFTGTHTCSNITKTPETVDNGIMVRGKLAAGNYIVKIVLVKSNSSPTSPGTDVAVWLNKTVYVNGKDCVKIDI